MVDLTMINSKGVHDDNLKIFEDEQKLIQLQTTIHGGRC